MHWSTLPEDLQDLVWTFRGDLRNCRQRLHKFVGLELRVGGLMRGRAVSPRYLRRKYRLLGVDCMKEILQLSYVQAQREALAKNQVVSR